MFKFPNRAEIVATAFLFFGPVAGIRACGPWLPNRLLSSGGKIILDAPEFYFEFELKQIAAAYAGPFKAVPPPDADYRQQTSNADIADLRDAIQTGAVTASDAAHAVELQTAFRAALASDTPTEPSTEQLPADSEFTIYNRGALALRKNDRAGAIAAWTELLNLPEKQRQYRSTWAAYMLGKLALDDNAENARRYFRQTRDLVAAGFHDNLGLASASFGWEGQVELNTNALEIAAPLYLRQLASGDITAVDSCKQLAGDAYLPAPLARFAADPILRRITSAHLLGQSSRGFGDPQSDDGLKTWLEAVQKANASTVEEADRLGWLAYTTGDFAQAAEWLQKADPQSGLALWLKAKLDFRAGKIDDALTAMSAAVRKIPTGEKLETYDPNPDQVMPGVVAAGDLGLLQVARADFITALKTFLNGDHWQDAAYIAERVLTIDELTKLVDAEFGRQTPAANAESDLPNLRWLLARQLVRAGEFEKARPYFPENIQPILDNYVKSLTAGHDKKADRAARAATLWEAAKVCREKGMELLGTELEPDAFIWEGEFEEDEVAAERRAGKWVRTDYSSGDHKTSSEPMVIPVSKFERTRLAHSGVSPEKRFHYRYVAADLAWQAAALMPGNSEATAQVLNTAGSWLKTRDSDAADRFIQAIERRCPDTPTGKAVLQKHWFIPQ